VLNALELAVETTASAQDGTITITQSVAEESIQHRAVLYDKDGDAHYDTISAFIKSVRGSDPDAALFWMAKMVYAGEDPRFIFRRLLILAGEDIGMADPKALGVVVDAARAFDYVGLPEGRYHLAHACLYCATAPKSNSSMAFFDALDAVSKQTDDEVPNPLRDASRDKEGFGHGKGYLYPHAYRDHWVAQQYLPDVLQGRLFYNPSDIGYEKGIKVEVSRRREAMVEAMLENEDAPSTAAWIQRTADSTGSMLAAVRDKLLGLAQLTPESLVLDVFCRTGLIALEAARRVSDGAVWTACHDDAGFASVKAFSREFDILHQPQSLRTSWDTLVADVYAHAGSTIKYDTIVGRNALCCQADKLNIVKNIVPLLAKKSRMVLAETVFSQGQRIAGLMRYLPPELKAAVEAAEEAFFTNPDDAYVNWTAASLAAEIGTLKGLKVAVSEEVYNGRRRITTQELTNWFRDEEAPRPSLGHYLVKTIGIDGLNTLLQFGLEQLANRETSWKTTVAYFVVTRVYY
jgi:putative ATPase